MNIFAMLNNNPVALYGLVGSVAGAMLGGSKKKRTQNALAFGAAGAAAGFFFDKSAQKKQQAAVRNVVAQEAAKEAIKEAVKAETAKAEMAGWGGHRRGHPRPPKGSRAYHQARQAWIAQSNVGAMAVPGVF